MGSWPQRPNRSYDSTWAAGWVDGLGVASMLCGRSRGESLEARQRLSACSVTGSHPEHRLFGPSHSRIHQQPSAHHPRACLNAPEDRSTNPMTQEDSFRAYRTRSHNSTSEPLDAVRIGDSARVRDAAVRVQIDRSGAADRPDLFPPIATFRHEFAASGQFFVKHQPGPHTDPARPDPTRIGLQNGCTPGTTKGCHRSDTPSDQHLLGGGGGI